MSRALFASVIATAVVSALIYLNTRMNYLPTFDLLVDIGRFNERIGLPATPQAIWVTHWLIGIALLGTLFAVIQPVLPGRGVTKGMSFGVIAWLMMMVAFMPLAQHEIFGQDVGIAFAVTTLALHLLYGGILGMTYSALGDGDD